MAVDRSLAKYNAFRLVLLGDNITFFRFHVLMDFRLKLNKLSVFFDAKKDGTYQ